MRLALAVPLFVLASTLAACALLDPTNDFAITVEPTQQLYVLSDTTEVRLRVKNNLTSTIYFDGCGKQRLERLDQGRLADSWIVDLTCECLCTVSVQGGEQVEIVTYVWELRTMAGELETEAAKSYRFSPVMYVKETNELVARADIRVQEFRFKR